MKVTKKKSRGRFGNHPRGRKYRLQYPRPMMFTKVSDRTPHQSRWKTFGSVLTFSSPPLYTKTGSFWKERALWNADLLFVLLVAYCLVQPPLTGTLVIRRGAMVRNVYLSWSTAVVSTFFHPVRVLLYISTRVSPAHRWRVSKNKAKTRFQLYYLLIKRLSFIFVTEERFELPE